ncbi:MAG: ferredoxin-type protein NapF [Luteibacter sp.]
MDEANFLDTCTRCNACVERCPEDVLVSADGGFPVFDPMRGECTFCGVCAEACAPRALNAATVTPAWHWKARVNDDACLTTRGVVCRCCEDACGDRAIGFLPRAGGVSTPTVHPDRCSGCGACISNCPTLAIALHPST